MARLRVFIAHKMTGDIEGNMAKVVEICKQIHSTELICIFPSALTRRYPLSQDPKDRAIAQATIEEYFTSGFVQELWLYGDVLTDGMKREVQLALENDIRVVAKTTETKIALGDILLAN